MKLPACDDAVHQHMSVIANDIPWYLLAGAVLIGAALVAYGAQMTFEHWKREAHLSGWFSVMGGVFGIFLASAMGAIAGHILWHWSLGLMCAVCGAWGSQWVLGLMSARFGVKNEAEPLPEARKGRRRG